MLTLILSIAALSLVVVVYQFSCFFAYQRELKKRVPVPIAPVCTEA